MEKQFIHPEGLARPGTYTPVVTARGGTTIWIAGQVPQDAAGQLVGRGDLPAQIASSSRLQCRYRMDDILNAIDRRGATRKSLICLIVDDMPNIRMVTKQILLNLGCTSVLETSSGEDALKLLSTHAVDLVLLDCILPHMSGIACLKAIRSDPKTSRIRCVMITADRVETHVREAITAGAAGYVMKPFSPRTLQTHLDLALSAREEAAQKRD